MVRLGVGGTSRRSFLRLGVSGLASLNLPGVLRARAAGSPAAKDTRVILFWLQGGPSHMDLWDMKPEAPAEYRGFWRPIPTNVPGIRISEMFPKQAKVADKFSIVRSLHHGDTDHPGSQHILMTGRAGVTVVDLVQKSPALAATVSRVVGPRRRGLPAHVVSPGVQGSYFGASYVGRAYEPFEIGGDPARKEFSVRNLTLPGGMTVERLDDRRRLRRSLDTMCREVETSGMMDAVDQFEQQAFELVTGSAVRRAFDLGAEAEPLRDRYGRNAWGQSLLLARRLAEAGVTFVTVNWVGWDQHANLKPVMLDYLPKVDAAVSALFEDLAARGLDEKVLVIVMGEMSRTPRMNNGSATDQPGRDHWNDAISLALGGGGVKGGRIVGATDPRGEYITERPVTVQDLHATIYHVLGIDPYTSFLNNAGRPVSAIDDGTPIRELF